MNPSRTISWTQKVEEADPNWQRGLVRPWFYQMSSGRLFYWDTAIYTRVGP